MEQMQSQIEAFARLHRSFLQSSNPKLLKSLEKDGILNQHCKETGQRAFEMTQALTAQMMNAPTLPTDYQQRVKALEAIPLTVDEIVRHEVIYQPPPQ